MKGKTILAVSPHTDDAEIAAGGTIAKLVAEGCDVHYVALSACEKSVPDKYPCDILRKEVKKATRALGIKPGNLQVMDFEVREFPRLRQEILEALVTLEKKIKPDVVISPSSEDIHQDHLTTRNEVVRAFRKCTILGFEMPWDNIMFQTQGFVPLKEKHLRKKLKALSCYGSQMHRAYLSEEYIRGLALTRGMQIKQKYAEAFEVIRWVITDV
ncbi:PIG-L deacetylase family protein [Candidatus Altiarchaeota archaeon]